MEGVFATERARHNLAEPYGKRILGACENVDAGTFWSGRIDEVRIYNRAVKIIGR